MAERRRWLLLPLALLGAAATVSLGLWQLDRAAQKRALQAELDQRGHLPALSVAALPAADEALPDALLHRRATLIGRWDPEPSHTLYLDNRPMDGRVGFFVLTPLQLQGREDWLLVQRGWVPRDQQVRERLPPVATEAGDVRIAGRLAAAPSRAFDLGRGVETGPIRQNVELSALQGETGRRLLPFVLLQEDEQTAPASAGPPADAPVRHWPAPTVDLHKHYGYAFQWFALAALILGLYVWFQVLAPVRRDRRRAERGADDPMTALPPDGPVPLAVHEVPVHDAELPRRARWQLWLVLLVCAAPVLASYFSFYVLDLRGSAYGELITPTRELPADLPLRTLSGEAVTPASLRGQWLLTYVPDAGRPCDEACERMLFMQRQLREMLGRDRDRLDKLVLLPDDLALTAAQLDALIGHGAPATVLRVDGAALRRWLLPAPGHRMGEHLFLIDPMGRWMLRSPAAPEPTRLKKDLERLMRANAGWDRPGR